MKQQSDYSDDQQKWQENADAVAVNKAKAPAHTSPAEVLTMPGILQNTAPVIGNVAYFPKPSGIVVLDFSTDQELPTRRGAGPKGALTLNVDGCSIQVPGRIEVQGATSVRYPKKSWILRFYKDDNYEEELYVKFGDSVPSVKWMVKADWIDPTMMRTILSFRLWEQMMLSRDGLPKKEVDNAWWGVEGVKGGMTSAAIGSPRTYPAVMTINGEFYGIMVLTLKGDPLSYNLDSSNPDHIFFDFDARGRGGDYGLHKHWKKFTSEGIGADEGSVGEWIRWEFPEWNTIDDAVKQKIRDLIDSAGAVINGSQEEFNENYQTHFDHMNLIDYLLMAEALLDYDGVTQDIQMVIYDLKKLYCLPWDKDSTFGMHYNNSGVSKRPQVQLIEYEDIESRAEREQILWRKVYHADTAAVEARYAQLRDRNVFTTDNLYHLIHDSVSKISPQLWDAEYEKWNHLLIQNNGRLDPNGKPRSARDSTSIYQILDWFSERLMHLDRRYNYQPA